VFQEFDDREIASPYVRAGWNERTSRLLEKYRRDTHNRVASLEELQDYAARVREKLGGIADDAVLTRLRDYNPDIFQIIFFQDALSDSIGFTAAIPLNEAGYIALVENHFDPSNPAHEHIAKQGEEAAALYVWLVYAPKHFIACTKALTRWALTLAPNGCTMFCRGANQKTYDFNVSLGYAEASQSYPNAPKGLLAMHPVRELPQKERVEVARSLADMMQVVAIRAATYMSEQECPYDEEFDGNDFCGAHLIGYVGDEPAGCIRIRFFGQFVKFERLAVRHEFRTSKLSFRLVREAMRYSARKGFTQVYGHARIDLVRFWQTFGFRPLELAEEFAFSDVAYIEMTGPIKASAPPLAIGDHPLVLIRPEGAWDRPGPLERLHNKGRRARVTAKLRPAA
jgi:predicted GNAT family N-acyltransferase